MVCSKCLPILRLFKTTDGLADFTSATQRIFLPTHPGLDLAQVGLGQRQQFVALALAFLSQQRVFAHHQPFAGIIRTGDLSHVACIEQRNCSVPVCASCWIAGPRRAVIQSSPAGRNACSIRALVSMPRSPTSTTWRSRKRLLQLGDLRRYRSRVGGIAFEHLDRNRTTISATQQADHQLRPVAATVPAVTVTSQGTTAALEIGRGHVVEHERAVLEMAACELAFDEALLAAEPVERGVDFAGTDTAKADCFPQRVAGSFAVEHPRRSELRRRVEQPGDDEPQRQVATALGRAAGQQVVEADAPGD